MCFEARCLGPSLKMGTINASLQPEGTLPESKTTG